MSPPAIRIRDGTPASLEPKEWFKAAKVGFQDQIITFLLRAYGLLLVVTVVIVFFQGFHFGGFSLPESFLNWLGGATIGEIAGLLVIACRASIK